MDQNCRGLWVDRIDCEGKHSYPQKSPKSDLCIRKGAAMYLNVRWGF